jgi:hypothetical protein
VVVGVVWLTSTAGANAEPRSVTPLAQEATGQAGYHARVHFALPATMVATIIVPTLDCSAGEGWIAARAGLQGVNAAGQPRNSLGFIGLECGVAGNAIYTASGAAGSQFVTSIPVGPGDKVKVVVELTPAIGKGADVSVTVRNLTTGREISGVDSGFIPKSLVATGVPYLLHPVSGFARIQYRDVSLAGMPMGYYSPQRSVIRDASTRDVLVSATALNGAGDGFSLISRPPPTT